MDDVVYMMHASSTSGGPDVEVVHCSSLSIRVTYLIFLRKRLGVLAEEISCW
jgi:hypothetical protein